MCLVGFASLQSPWAHTLRHPCLACPSRCTQPFHPHNHCKRTIIHRSALNLPPLSKVRCCRPKKFGRLPEGLPHQPSQNRTIPPTFRRGAGLPLPLHRPSPFPQPSKIANTLASLVKGEVLSPEKIRATTGGIATPLLPKPHYPSKIANTLASLVKGEVLSPS